MREPNELSDVKAAYTAATAGGDVAGMLACAENLLSLSPTLGTAQLLINTLPVELPDRMAVKLKVAFLRSYTVEPAVPFLKALARLYGVELTVKVGEFNSYAQEIIDPAGWLYEFGPHVVVLALQTRDVAPDLWYRQIEASPDEAASRAASIASPIVSLMERLRSHTSASLIVQNLEQPAAARNGLLDSRREFGQTETIRSINRTLSMEALKHDGIYILDYDALTARHGRERWSDEKKFLTSRSPVAADCLILAAREYLRFILPLSGRQSKVLVVDLDNTLWGGVIGEDGANGIQIGSEYPGATYLALQRVILDIADRGVLLAICSKNNPQDAMDVLENRPEMLLRPKHFAAVRINWNDKAQNLREIAAELNVGIDTIAFLDDNPVERQRVKLALPGVVVVDLPRDPAGYAHALLACPAFERLTVTAEDRARGSLYAAQRARQSSQGSTGSLEDFYRSLEMTAEIVAVTPLTLARIAQLTQKTNQLNTTTRRYTESEVQVLSRDPAWKLFGMTVADKFGDNGLVGVVFLKVDGTTMDIDTFLLSCRVIGRTVETAMLAHVCDLAAAAGCTTVSGWFLPTKKNEPAAKIYVNHSFKAVRDDDRGTLWHLAVHDDRIEKPAWIAWRVD